MITICGLWKNETKEGRKYLSGTLGGIKILVFPNEKKTDRQPDYNIVIAENKKSVDTGGQAMQPQKTDASQQTTKGVIPEDEIFSDAKFPF